MTNPSPATALSQALLPFSEIAGEMFAQNWEINDEVFAVDFPDGHFTMTAGAFFALRAAAKTHLPEVLAENAAMREVVELFVKQWNACGPNSAFGEYFTTVRRAAVEALASSSALTEGRNLDGSERRETVAVKGAGNMSNHSRAVAEEVLAERLRQVASENWTPEHDDHHVRGEMAQAAACYASVYPLAASYWPWDLKWWKPTDRRRNLVKAGALIQAEIERLDRSALASQPAPEAAK